MSENTRPATTPELWADEYHLRFSSWYASLASQTKAITKILAEYPLPINQVVDGSCGVGTWAMGLAAAGYEVTACDISSEMVQQCRSDAAAHGVVLKTQEADIRTLDLDVKTTSDCALVFNGFPHLKSDEELDNACSAVHRCLRVDGLLVASIRDYDGMLSDLPSGYAPRLKPSETDERITFQMWEWQKGLHLVRYFTLDRDGQEWSVKEARASYRPLRRSVLTKALMQAGFEDILWLMPEETGFEQPIVTARAAA